MLYQQIKFKNDYYGNPRCLVVGYERLKKGSRHLYPTDVFKLGYSCIEQVIKKTDSILPTVYTYDSYSKTLRETKAIIK